MPAEPKYSAPDPREVDPRIVRRAFSRAAATFDAAAILQREVAARMAQRLDYIKLAPLTILEAGCGTGGAIGELALRYPSARILALDVALPMLTAARRRVRGSRSMLRKLLAPLMPHANGAEPFFVCADIESLPLRGVAFDLVWSNLVLVWANDLPRVLAECRRVLKVGGLLTFTTLGPDTLKELRAAFVRSDGYTHTNRFIDMHDVGDMLIEAGFADPVMDMEQLTLTYSEPRALLEELKAVGASNATRGRPRGLMGRARWQRMLAALERLRRDGRVPATFEIIYGHAWKGEPKQTDEGHAIVKLQRKKP
ncbi:MAG: malonyl-ACP O-methyltransferase BioC [Betaproteobacteria bacterium]|nr:MAG: malonyl-ACP O-methyltransferase BioC [Betaproteobacteria bacterium]